MAIHYIQQKYAYTARYIWLVLMPPIMGCPLQKTQGSKKTSE